MVIFHPSSAGIVRQPIDRVAFRDYLLDYIAEFGVLISKVIVVKLNTEGWFDTKMPIVVADDEPQIRNLNKRVLSNHGFSVFEAEDGVDAFAIIRELDGEISLLISDIDMPHLDGASLCRIVKDRYPPVPVLLMSGIPESDECNVGDVFLHKPSQMHRLSKVVSDCLP